MTLTKGLRFSRKINISDIKINSGSVLYEEMCFEKLDFPFRKNAFIPRNDWRDLSAIESEKLLINSNNCGEFIALGKVSDQLIKIIKDFKIHGLRDRNKVLGNLRSNESKLSKFNDEINKLVESLCRNKKDIEFHRLSVIPSGRYVTSINLNDENFEYIGLHIDHSTAFNIETAHLSKNRICINIGNENRFLYAINLSLLQIKKMLSEKMDISNLNVENISDNFFKYYQDYPVLKIMHKPFEYYIAPTDSFIHDGSTFNNNYLDITVTFIGKFEAE